MAEIAFGHLTAGDRFVTLGAVWTKLDANAARQHDPRSYDKPGYRLNGIYTFADADVVKFVPIEPVSLEG